MSSPSAFCSIHCGGTGAASPEILPTTSRCSESARRSSARAGLISETTGRPLKRSASTRHESSTCLQSSPDRRSCRQTSPAIRSRAFTLGRPLPRRELSVLDLGRGAVFGMVGATTREAMQRHAREFAESGCRLIYDPSQQVVSLAADELREGIDQAWGVIGSDYEMAVIEQKTGLTVSDLVARVPFVGVTFAEHGSELHFEGQHVKIPAVAAEPLIEPTGGGDAYRAGVFKGLALGLPLEIAGRMGSVAATYAVERHGSQEHTYTPAEFVDRFEAAFPEYAGAVRVEWLCCPVDRDLAESRLSGHAVRGD